MSDQPKRKKHSTLGAPDHTVRMARKLRKEMSLPEVLLWVQLQQHPGGYLFRKQHPFGPYALDFACVKARLAIEVDGETHNRGDRPERDAVRDEWVLAQGFDTIRFPAKEVLENMEGVLITIVEECQKRALPNPPRNGEVAGVARRRGRVRRSGNSEVGARLIAPPPPPPFRRGFAVITSLLIANRGEIACRIIRTARAMGIRTVAVYSDADAKALHVRQADEAVHIGASPARESYLVGEKIIAAALAAKAEAIHPGYGFLSENAEFAQAVIDAGLIWVGAAPASITAMGLKDAAKKLMADAGVPVTPGYMGENQDPAFLGERAAEIGYPVLIKAVAGGGGKGMRKVEDAADFTDALASCQREATASFGNAHVLIEKYIQRPRHIEVQVFGDTHGNIVHLFERDCSLQRRHQKVIEEAPAPGMDGATREILCAVAVKAAKAVDYVGAGTIEFIADASEGLRADRIWFMEMNTRLQVEHPVTELITGVDLVEWQLIVASGNPLPWTQDRLAIHGHAIEARLYAEDPSKGSLPSIGQLEHFELPDRLEPYEYLAVNNTRHMYTYDAQLRVDTGYEQGDEVSPFYDPMIAKLIAHAPDRLQAEIALTHAVSNVRCWPVITNASMLHALLVQPDFVCARLTTSFIDDHPDVIYENEGPGNRLLDKAAQLFVDPEIPLGLTGFRLNADTNHSALLTTDSGEAAGDLHWQYPEESDHYFWAERVGDAVFASSTGRTHRITIRQSRGDGHHHASSGAILSPMPGRIIAVDVIQGQSVTKGQKLLTLEAMKMEHSLTAPFDGVVAELNAEVGAQVQVDALLVQIAAEES